MRPQLRTPFGIFVFFAALIASMESPGCGGIVVDSGGPDGSIAPGSTSGAGGVGGNGGRGTGGAKPHGSGGKAGAICGNGRLDSNEDCDGTTFRFQTCASATMGAATVGELRCTKACTIDIADCSFEGSGGFVGGGFGGTFGGSAGFSGGGIGGTFGGGGSVGDAGVANCYALGGVPVYISPGVLQCETGGDAGIACTNEYLQRDGTYMLMSASCGYLCACNACGSSFAQCLEDDSCLPILMCAEKTGCNGIDGCYRPETCQGQIDALGGPMSRATTLFDIASQCLLNANCSLSCSIHL